MRTPVLFLRRAAGLVLIVGAASAAGACGDDDDTPQKRYFAAMCDALDECCTAAGKTNSTSSCRTLYALGTTDQEFDEARSKECIAQLEATAGTMALCGKNFKVAALCDSVMKDTPDKGGSVQPGQPCQESEDCAVVEGATTVFCSGSGSGEGSTCQAFVTRTVGQSCEDQPGYSVSCDKETESYCDSGTRLCTPPAAEGEACNVGNHCHSDLYCALVSEGSYACAKRLGAGAACVGDFCAKDLYCDAQSVCVAKLADGQPCASYQSCQSGNCTDEVCKSSGSGLVSICFSSD